MNDNIMCFYCGKNAAIELGELNKKIFCSIKCAAACALDIPQVYCDKHLAWHHVNMQCPVCSPRSCGSFPRCCRWCGRI